MIEFIAALLCGIVFVSVLKGLKRDETKIRAGKDAKRCPDCAEWVQRDARVCRYCRHDFMPEIEAQLATRQARAESSEERQARLSEDEPANFLAKVVFGSIVAVFGLIALAGYFGYLS